MKNLSSILTYGLLIGVLSSFWSCAKNEEINPLEELNITPEENLAIQELLHIDLTNLNNYQDQLVPSYITKDNSGSNLITDKGATLGRVLFYDTQLSSNNTISCASCHKQENAFSDPARRSIGVSGLTTRHSMRLINARFGEESKFFWDERAASLEEQTTMPIKDPVEMGFSGEDGNPSFDDLLEKLQQTTYYPILFNFVYGSPEITEERMQLAMAQFIRSIQSFDSKYDLGRAQVNSDTEDFPNFTADENKGKELFMGDFTYSIQAFTFTTRAGVERTDNFAMRNGVGMGCASCHRAPEFDIDPNSKNNGQVATINDRNTLDTIVKRSPSLRDIFKADGSFNSGFFHIGGGVGVNRDVNPILEHYKFIPNAGPSRQSVDSRLRPDGFPIHLNFTEDDKRQLAAFLFTLGGSNVYVDEKWSNPFK